MPCLGDLGSIDTSSSHSYITNVSKGGSTASPHTSQPTTPFDFSEAHYFEADFYDEFIPCGEDATSKPIRTPLLDWEVIKEEPEVDLRGILDQKKKKRVCREASGNKAQLRRVQVQLLDRRLGYRLWWYAGPSCLKQKGPGLNEASTTLACCCPQETAAPVEHSLNNIVEIAAPVEHSFDNIAESCEELLPAPNLSLPAYMELGVVNLSNDPNVPWTTSINANLSQLEKTQLIAILKEYADVFAWQYNEMPGLDPNLVVYALNVEPRVKSVIQPMRTFHSDIET